MVEEGVTHLVAGVRAHEKEHVVLVAAPSSGVCLQELAERQRRTAVRQGPNVEQERRSAGAVRSICASYQGVEGAAPLGGRPTVCCSCIANRR